MAQKISAYSNNTTIASADEMVMVDTSNTTNQATGETEKRTFANIASWLATLTQTVTNKDLTDTSNTFSEVTTTTSSSTPTPTGGSRENELYVTALAANATIAAPTGTASQGNRLVIRITDNGTNRTLAYNSIYRAIGVTLPSATTANKTIYLGCIYNNDDSKWDVVAVAEAA